MHIQRTQSGFALILFVVVLLAGSLFALSGSLNTSAQNKKQNYQSDNYQRLKKAKEALLSYSVDYVMRDEMDRMGILPCPDIDGGANSNGNSDMNCGNKGINTIGYFPYKTVDLGKTEDASKECFWYVVSGNYKNEPYGLLNKDSVGYLKVVDENGVLQHGSNLEDYPIALIISPGKNIGKNRTQVSDLSDCEANYSIDNYLEFSQGGAIQQYSSTLTYTADTEWTFLQPSLASTLKDVDYNDQIIAIYKDELWDKIEKMGDLSFNNGQPANSAIEKLTKKLAECIAAFGNDTSGNPNKNLPYPSPVDLVLANTSQREYADNNNYNDSSSAPLLLHGRFPQVLDNSVRNTGNFVKSGVNDSYCKLKAGFSSEDEAFWENWKDHFFLVVAEDFKSSSTVPANNTKCTVNGCPTVNGESDKIAAMVIYSGHTTTDRNWKWDVASAQTKDNIDNKASLGDYLEGDNATQYNGGNSNFVLEATDYSYCVKYNSSFDLSAVRCGSL